MIIGEIHASRASFTRVNPFPSIEIDEEDRTSLWAALAGIGGALVAIAAAVVVNVVTTRIIDAGTYQAFFFGLNTPSDFFAKSYNPYYSSYFTWVVLYWMPGASVVISLVLLMAARTRNKFLLLLMIGVQLIEMVVYAYQLFWMQLYLKNAYFFLTNYPMWYAVVYDGKSTCDGDCAYVFSGWFIWFVGCGVAAASGLFRIVTACIQRARASEFVPSNPDENIQRVEMDDHDIGDRVSWKVVLFTFFGVALCFAGYGWLANALGSHDPSAWSYMCSMTSTVGVTLPCNTLQWIGLVPVVFSIALLVGSATKNLVIVRIIMLVHILEIAFYSLVLFFWIPIAYFFVYIYWMGGFLHYSSITSNSISDGLSLCVVGLMWLDASSLFRMWAASWRAKVLSQN